MTNSQPIACDLTVFPASVREELARKAVDIFRPVQVVRELPNGYAFQFPNEPGQFMAVAYFVEHERQCCPFYKFTVEVEPNGGPIWLHLTGSDEVKKFIEAAWSDLNQAVAKKLMKTGDDVDLEKFINEVAPVTAGLLEKASPQ